MLFKSQFQKLEDTALKIVNQVAKETWEVLKDEKATVTKKREAIATLQANLTDLDHFYGFEKVD